MEDERNIRGIPDNRASWGFSCSACTAPLLLSDHDVSGEIMACFTLGATSTLLTCPKCGITGTYTCDDLKILESDAGPPTREKKAQAGSSE